MPQKDVNVVMPRQNKGKRLVNAMGMIRRSLQMWRVIIRMAIFEPVAKDLIESTEL